jgi:clorobiocin biosynthesis protein CloN4
VNLHTLVIDTAARHPDRLAVACRGDTLTYRELDRRADAFARRLRQRGVRRGHRVLLWSDKSIDIVVAMQAVLRLGAAYVPMDGTAPVRRVATLATDCAATAICADSDRIDTISSVLTGTPLVDLREAAITVDSPAPVNEPVHPDQLAYILYTSGSTGTPKGVCLSHANALAFVKWAVGELELRPHDRLANHAPLVFDLSVLDLYAAFASGASVHLLPADLAYSPDELVRFVRTSRITVWYSVPSALVLMMRHGGLLDEPPPAELRVVCFAGEPFPIAGVRSLAAWTPARLLNLYGPTETNVCTFHEVVPSDLARDRPVPIGRACSGDTVWAERATGEVAEPGEEGELLVDGPTVLMGYWGAPPQQGPYHTGDIVRVLPGGSFDYVGRVDHTVKVRGHRIGLAEVEAAIAAHPAVADVAVIVAGDGIEARLVAFVVPAPGAAPGRLAIKAHCAATLPSYAVVDQVHLASDLPRTGNGKVDRRALAGRTETRRAARTVALAQERRPG